MNRVLAAGVGLTALGIAGYAVGVGVAYPGRAFSVTALMAGISLAVMGRSLSTPGDDAA